MKALYSMILAMLLLVIPQHARAEQVVDVDKKWTIEFSQPVDVSTLHGNITIVNTQTDDAVAIKPLVVSKDGRFVTVEPHGTYGGASYEVRVSTNVKSSANEAIRAPFTKVFITDETCTKYDALKKEHPVADKVIKVKDVAELGVCRQTREKTYTMDRSFSSTVAGVTYEYVGESQLYYYIEVHGRLMLISKQDANVQPGTRTTYHIENGTLYRNNKNTFLEAPHFLQQGKTYYSTDGQWFYDEANQLAGVSYNYFQNVSIFAPTIYTTEELNQYIQEHFEENEDYAGKSIIKQAETFGTTLKKIEQETGINALFLLAFAAHESKYGTSNTVHSEKFKNNIYSVWIQDGGICGHPEKKCYYESIHENAADVVKRLLTQYLAMDVVKSEKKTEYKPTGYSKGAVIGNQAYGLNARYATDVEWGGIIANYVREFDRELGAKDQNKRGLIAFYNYEGDDELTLYTEPNWNKKFTTIYEAKKRPMTVVAEAGEFYKVYNDYAFVADEAHLQHIPKYVYVRKSSFLSAPNYMHSRN